jgi:NDP-sugar pyrophosphorylase family protein
MRHKINKAMILAAGEGTRLRPLTLDTPKPLLPLNGKPLIEYTLLWLKQHGIEEVAINLYHHGDKIKQHLGDGKKYDLKLHYSPESKLMGTAGGVKKVESYFDGPLVVVYGDMLTDFNLSEMMALHVEQGNIATIALMPVERPWEVGVVVMDDNSRITSFVEKPPRGTEPGNLANAGIYVLEREVLDIIPSNTFCDFGHDILPKLINSHKPFCGYCLKKDDYILDTGTVARYEQADKDARNGRIKINNSLVIGSADWQSPLCHSQRSWESRPTFPRHCESGEAIWRIKGYDIHVQDPSCRGSGIVPRI